MCITKSSETVMTENGTFSDLNYKWHCDRTCFVELQTCGGWGNSYHYLTDVCYEEQYSYVRDVKQESVFDSFDSWMYVFLKETQ